MSYTPITVQVISARKTARNYVNGSGSTIAQGVVVSTLTSGLVSLVDVSSQSSVDAVVGVYNQSTPNTASGQVLDSGVLENFTTSFAIGDPVYVDKTGGLTNITPVAGSNGFVTGDFVIFVGVIVQNEFNPSNKDLKILIEKPGTL